MKTIGFLLLSLFSISASAQNYEPIFYPKWYAETIPGHPDDLDALRIPFSDPVPVKTISLSTGVKLEYVEQGDPNGLPVLLVHGFPDSWRSYEQVLSYLPKSYHVFAISLRGHGNSDKPAKGYFPKDFAADIAAFIKAFSLPPAIVVGHSMGATITQQFVISYPELVRGIVLEGAIVSFNDRKEMVDFKEMVNELQDPMDTAIAREFQKSTLANPIAEEYFDLLLSESMKVKANVWKGVWEGLITTANYRKKIGRIKKPALIIWGDKDNFGPRADQEFLAFAIEGAQLIIYEGTGHSLHWEEPLRFSKDLTKFIEEIK